MLDCVIICVRDAIGEEKSKTGKAEVIKFLGMTIVAGMITISSMSMSRANDRLCELIPGRTNQSIESAMEKLNTWYRGWSGYYGMTEDKHQLQRVEAHARRRLRSRIVYEHKRPRNLKRTLLKRGVSEYGANRIINNMSIWATSRSPAMHKAFPSRYFIEELGQFIYSA